MELEAFTNILLIVSINISEVAVRLFAPVCIAPDMVTGS